MKKKKTAKPKKVNAGRAPLSGQRGDGGTSSKIIRWPKNDVQRIEQAVRISGDTTFSEFVRKNSLASAIRIIAEEDQRQERIENLLNSE